MVSFSSLASGIRASFSLAHHLHTMLSRTLFTILPLFFSAVISQATTYFVQRLHISPAPTSTADMVCYKWCKLEFLACIKVRFDPRKYMCMANQWHHRRDCLMCRARRSDCARSGRAQCGIACVDISGRGVGVGLTNAQLVSRMRVLCDRVSSMRGQVQ
jgi:hypothetical protein